jgi:MFS family permease
MTQPALWQRLNLPSAVAITLMIQTTISLLGAAAPVLAPMIAADRNLNASIIMFYSPLICIAAFVMNFLVPGLLYRVGGMGLSLICLTLSALGLLCLLPSGTAVLVAVPVLIGLSSGAMNPASSQILGPRSTSQTAGLIMSLKQTGVPLGSALVGVLLPFMVLHWGWRSAVLDVVLASIVLILICLPTVRWLNGAKSAKPMAGYRPLEPLKRIIAMPGMLNFLLAAMIFTGMQHCLRSFFTIYLVDRLGLPLTVAGTAFAASQVAGIVGQIAWAVMSDRALGSDKVMAIIGTIIALAAALTAIMNAHWPVSAIVTVGVLFGVSAAGFVPVVLAEVARRSPAGQVGALTSGANLFIISGVLLGPLAFGAVGALFDYATAFAVLGACTLAVSILAAKPRQILRMDLFAAEGHNS